LFARPLVYNTKRTGTVRIGRRTFELRRVSFPAEPTAEWYVVDLMRNAESVGLTQEKLAAGLRTGLEEGRFSAGALAEMAARFGRRAEQNLVRQVTTRSWSLETGRGME
jgi:hypothetical protein